MLFPNVPATYNEFTWRAASSRSRTPSPIPDKPAYTVRVINEALTLSGGMGNKQRQVLTQLLKALTSKKPCTVTEPSRPGRTNTQLVDGGGKSIAVLSGEGRHVIAPVAESNDSLLNQTTVADRPLLNSVRAPGGDILDLANDAVSLYNARTSEFIEILKGATWLGVQPDGNVYAVANGELFLVSKQAAGPHRWNAMRLARPQAVAQGFTHVAVERAGKSALAMCTDGQLAHFALHRGNVSTAQAHPVAYQAADGKAREAPKVLAVETGSDGTTLLCCSDGNLYRLSRTAGGWTASEDAPDIAQTHTITGLAYHFNNGAPEIVSYWQRNSDGKIFSACLENGHWQPRHEVAPDALFLIEKPGDATGPQAFHGSPILPAYQRGLTPSKPLKNLVKEAIKQHGGMASLPPGAAAPPKIEQAKPSGRPRQDSAVSMSGEHSVFLSDDHRLSKVEGMSKALILAGLQAYALNDTHPVGKEKAKLFENYLGFKNTDAHRKDIAEQILKALRTEQAEPGKVDEYAVRFQVYVPMKGPKGKAIVRVAVAYKTGSDVPEVITMFPDLRRTNQHAAQCSSQQPPQSSSQATPKFGAGPRDQTVQPTMLSRLHVPKGLMALINAISIQRQSTSKSSANKAASIMSAKSTNSSLGLSRVSAEVPRASQAELPALYSTVKICANIVRDGKIVVPAGTQGVVCMQFPKDAATPGSPPAAVEVLVGTETYTLKLDEVESVFLPESSGGPSITKKIKGKLNLLG